MPEQKLPDMAPDQVSDPNPEDIAPEPVTPHQGSSEPEPSTPTPQARGPHDDKRAAIAENWENTRRNEPSPTAGVPIHPLQAQAQPPAPEPEMTMEEAEQVIAADDHLVKLTIDGQEKYVRVGDLRPDVQKYLAGDKRLAEAKTLIGELKKLQAGLRNQETPSQTGNKPEAPAQQPLLDDEKLLKIAERIQLGEPEEARNALKELVTAASAPRSESPPFDPNSIRLTINDMNSEKALEAYAQEHPDMVNDPVVFKVMQTIGPKLLWDDLVGLDGIDEDALKEKIRTEEDLKLVHRKAESLGMPVRNRHQLMIAAYEAANDYLSRRAPPQSRPNGSPPNQQSMPQRVERKRTTVAPQPSQRSTPGQGQQQAQPVNELEARRAAFLQMRKGRGQPV